MMVLRNDSLKNKLKVLNVLDIYISLSWSCIIEKKIIWPINVTDT